MSFSFALLHTGDNMKKITRGATRLIVLALGLGLLPSAWADFTKTNPVTGETENYTWKFVGTADNVWNSNGNWQDSNGDNPDNGGIPAKTSGGDVWNPILFDGSDVNINASMSVEGWNLRMGLYNGASVTMNTFVKYQGDTTMWMTVDETSQLTVGGFGGGNISDNQAIKLSVAKANGIVWNVGLESTGTANNTFEYYLKGSGSVSYQAVSSADHKIKMADVTLSGATKSVQSKTLVSFTSSDKTFTADATIKVLSNNAVVGTEVLETVNTTGTTTLTTADRVGACELVQTSTGIVLYYVDGSEYEEETYTPSININFTYGTGYDLTTSADVGLAGYAVPGTSWNQIPLSQNIQEGEGVLNEVKSVDSTGSASVESGVSVTVTGARGSYYCWNGVAAASDPRHGYIDEGGGYETPTITVAGVPYANYRVVVYCATDTANAKFGYVTVNGTDCTFVDGRLMVGTTSWGNAGGNGGALAIAEGVNTLVTDVLSGSTATVVGHRMSDARGCIAAIQIVKVEMDADLVITVNGDTTYTVAESATYGKVQVLGSGTLAFDGTGTITAGTFDVGPLVAVKVGAGVAYSAVIGAGTVVYDGAVPPTGMGWTDSTTWTGTVWIKNKSGITGNDNATTGVRPNSLGNSLSRVKFSGVSGWIEAPVEYAPEIVLENDSYSYALQLIDGNSPNSTYTNRATVIKKLSGSGTLCCGGTSSSVPVLKVYDASGFVGSINTANTDATKTGLVVVFCDESTELPDSLVNLFINSGLKRTIYVASGKEVSLDAAATWTAETGFIIEGTLNVNGALASSAAAVITGAGTVIFTGKAPAPTGDAWWKSAGWTGTVQVKSVNNMVGSGSGTNLAFNDYGNEGSTLELNGCTGWLPGPYECTVPLKITGTLNLNNGLSDRDHIFTINHLKGNGTIYGGSTADKVIIRVKEWSEFTGLIQLDKKIVVFGEDEMPVKADLTAGQIIVSAGAVVTNVNSTANGWWATGGIKVNGELCSPDLARFGGGTTITTTDNGVFTLTSTGNGTSGEINTDYARITGTGSLKYDGLGWRALSTNNFPTAMTLIDEQRGDILLSSALTYTVGSLAGTKNLQGNYDSGARYLRVLQSKDTEWSGIVVSDNSDRFKGLMVAPGASTAGTLTLSGTQVKAQTLTVESGAKVNLTGTWKGATTVAGTFGGTGTLTGNLTLSDGATIAVNGVEPLKVTGDVTLLGDIVIVVADDADVSRLTILRVTGDSALNVSAVSSFTVMNESGKAVRARVEATSKELRLSKSGFYIHLQ